jgi:hypothetical protein
LTVTSVGPATLSNGTNLDYDLDQPGSAPGAGGNDLLALNNTSSTLGTGIKLNITGGTTFNAGFTDGLFHLIQLSSTPAFDLSTWTVTGFATSAYTFSNNTTANTIDLTITNTVPEPAAIGLLGIGALGLLRRRRRLDRSESPHRIT